MECLVENLANGETLSRSQVDDLPFAVAIRISPAHIGEAEMSFMCQVTHVCVDQVEASVAFIHSPGKVKCLVETSGPN